MARSVQTLDVESRRVVASWAADCAEDVLATYENAVPDDSRVREAIAWTRAFASGDLTVAEAILRRGADAGAAAREAPTAAAKAAAYAAQHAAAVAHMGAHALGAAGYAAQAKVLAEASDDTDAVQSAVMRYVDAMDAPIAAALSSLPALSEDRAGPLGPGLLSRGQVGQAIRTIQAHLDRRHS